MSPSNFANLTEYYETLESQVDLRISLNGLKSAVTFAENRPRPIHNWFHFKEGFSADIFSHLGIDTSALTRRNSVFVDPFCGIGTTLVAGDLEFGWKGRRIGIEVNPFLHFVASTKTQWRKYDSARLESCVGQVLSHSLRTDLPFERWPKLSTLRRPEAFEPSRVSALVDAVERVSNLNARERDLLLLGIASAAEKLSYYRKDGRALRILHKEGELQNRASLQVEDVLRETWLGFATQIEEMRDTSPIAPGPGRVYLGDGISLTALEDAGLSRGQVNMFGYSPPYLNHIDYTEVYKVELWLLGYVDSPAEMLQQRRRTLRSHASIRFDADGVGLPTAVIEIIEMLANEVERTGKNWHRYFRQTAYGYFQDMQQALKRQFEYLVQNGLSVCIVGNSAHGSGQYRVPVATDLLVAEIARSVGFTVSSLLVARQTPRSAVDSPYLRETAIFLQKK